MAINSTISGILRAYPVIMMYSTVLLYIMTSDLDFLYLLMMLFLGEGINHTLKYKVLKPIFGDHIPILGQGSRPAGAKDCGIFLSKKEKKLTSYGMPSGHSQNSALFATFLILKLLGEGINISLIIKIAIIGGLSLSVMASRWIFNCHTVGQILIGATLGIFFGATAFKFKDYVYFVMRKSLR
jgi:membrane-associated phospholipid phosphatase|tara:strand:- start:254 stop:802 length:549 start_codon:yes stop_codon:yes gene_type:complete